MTETYQVALRDDESFCPRCYRAALRLLEHGGRMERERDEAREEIKGWKLKWKCAVEIAALSQNKLEAAK